MKKNTKFGMKNMMKALKAIGYDSYADYYEDRYETIRERIDHEYFCNPIIWAGSRHIIGFDFFVSFSDPYEDKVSYKVTAETYHQFKYVAEKYVDSAMDAEVEAYHLGYVYPETFERAMKFESEYKAFRHKVING